MTIETFPLVRTWREVADRRAAGNTGTDFLEVINECADAHFTFRVTSERGHLHLRVYRKPVFAAEEVRRLLSGSVPVLLQGESIRLIADSGTLEVPMLPPSAPAELEIEAEYLNGVQCMEFCGALGVGLPLELRDFKRAEEHLYSRTKLGAFSRRRSNQLSVTLGILGEESWFPPRARIQEFLERDEDSYSFRQTLPYNLGVMIAAIRPGESSVRCVEAISGLSLLPPRAVRAIALRPLRGAEVLVEVSSEVLLRNSLGGLGPSNVVADVVRAVNARLLEEAESELFSAFIQTVRQRDAILRAQRLSRRIANAQNRPKVLWSGRDIFCVPANENETISLYMKLEALGALPVAQLTVIEYTPRDGIDALATYQRDGTTAAAVLAPTEFEYAFGNFFRHEHPAGQVKLVICWSLDRDDGDLPPDLRVEPVAGGGRGVYFATVGQHAFDVLVLCEAISHHMEEEA